MQAARYGFRIVGSCRETRRLVDADAALSGYENTGRRDFDISAHTGVDQAGYDALEPFMWPAPADAAVSAGLGQAGAEHRFFAEGGFYTPDRRARFVVPAEALEPSRPPDSLTLNSGRTRDQWHTLQIASENTASKRGPLI